ncbi:MAG TPA: AtzH-like domain-containing protein [Candidatus Manganitrophaceae bacterium]|nr:AtzH-like domain-containing protein [Candidatus Manganitrophaceae bacterium]
MEEKAVKEVRDAIDRFIKAVEGRNIEALGKVVAHEKELVFYGSQAGDKQVGWDAIKASFLEQFGEASSIKSEVLDSTISVAGEMAWAAYDLRYSEAGGRGEGGFDSRWTCVLRRYRDGWKFVHMHHSRGR